MRHGTGMAITVTGVLSQLTGLALDAWLHARDATLAAREGPFTLENPGHLLFIVGLGLTVVGVGMLLVGRLMPGRAGAARWALSGVVGLVALMVAGAGGVAAMRGGGHTHAGAAEIGHAHHETLDGTLDISWERLQEIDRILGEAKAATEKYRDVAAARADGYLQLTPVTYGEGSHFLNPSLLTAGVFDLERPPVLIYDQTAAGDWELLGVAWALPRLTADTSPPPSPFWPLATWHRHSHANVCVVTTEGRLKRAPYDEGQCQATGGLFIRWSEWLLHAWLFRPSPEGIFSDTNSTVE